MAQTIRITITPELDRALQVLRKSTSGTLNTTEIIKMAIGRYASINDMDEKDVSPKDWDRMSARLFYEWAKEDGSINVDNISPKAKLKPFIPKPYVPDR